MLCACSWRPVYYQNSSDIPVQTISVDILPVPEENGRLLVQQLKDLLNPQNEQVEKEYTLSVRLEENLDTDQGILGDNTATRATMNIKAHYVLKKKDTVLLSDSTFATSSYNILMLPYPTITAEDKTRKRLIDVLADKIAMRIAVFIQNQVNNK